MAWKSTNKETKKPNEIITERIIEALNSGIIPWKRPWEALEVMSVEGRPYNGVNRMLLSWAGYADPRFLTYKKCTEMGGTVKKGEHGWPVVLWNFRNVNVKKGDETLEKSVPFMRYYYVFNVEQCEGIQDKLKPLAVKNADFQPIDKAKEIVDNYPNRPAINHGGNEAYYRSSTDSVQMPAPESFTTAEAYYSTLFHELIHSTGHESRLNRETKNTFGSEKYSKEELIAEIGSAFLRAECHIDTPETEQNTLAYIQNWIQVLQNDPNMVIRASSQAQKAADYMLNRQAVKGEPSTEQVEAMAA